MRKEHNTYRRIFSLIIVFLVLISVVFVIALFIAYNLTANYVENEFSSKKIDVLEQTIKPYNNLFQNKIPEITSYQGFLDSASAAKYTYAVFQDYPFVKRVVFYDMLIGRQKHSTIVKNNLGINIKAIYQYAPQNGKVLGSRKWLTNDQVDFNQMAVKLSDYITFSDTSRGSTQTISCRNSRYEPSSNSTVIAAGSPWVTSRTAARSSSSSFPSGPGRPTNR